MGGHQETHGQRVPPQYHLSAAFHPLCQAGVKQEETRLGEGGVERLLVLGSVNCNALKEITSQEREWGGGVLGCVCVCVGGSHTDMCTLT